MKILRKAPDGGASSGVTGYSLIECKSLCTVVLLRFNPGTREAFHSHAFNAVTLWLRGSAVEHQFDGTRRVYRAGAWKITRRACTHKVDAQGVVWALSFRGPWRHTWDEVRNGERVTLTYGREVVA